MYKQIFHVNTIFVMVCICRDGYRKERKIKLEEFIYESYRHSQKN